MTNTTKSPRAVAHEMIENLTDDERRAIVHAGEVEAVARIAALPENVRRAMTIALCLW